MPRASWLWALAFGAAYGQAPAAEACGGLFCGQPQPLQQQQPVDQMAERILFSVHDNSVTMVVQIGYTGSAPDFAWVLPLGDVPDAKSLNVFPQRGLNVLDANTALRFIMPVCSVARATGTSQAGSAASPVSARDAAGPQPAVTVHYQEEVGPYDVAAIESEDPMALYAWLRDNEYNVNDSMLPYIRTYTDEGMKFLALKLQKGKDSSDIEPFRFDLPGTTPSIPLRMTALAAEPEMSILVFVAADRRYGGANWPEVSIEDGQISWRVNAGLQTNWDALIARGVDEAGGQGWVTEFAGSAEPLVQNLTFMNFSTDEEMEAVDQLLDVIESTSYITRLHTRLSAEEMTLDPVFRRDSSGDVSSTHQLVNEVEGVDQCAGQSMADPCVFTSCGAGGLCRTVSKDGQRIAGCACVDGSTARTTITPPGMAGPSSSGAASVACQDRRMSFANPGTSQDGVKVLDPCLNFDCGPYGACEPVNMTPTCICDHGYVATGSVASDGTRNTRCSKPVSAVPSGFYALRLPDLPESLPGGRTTSVDLDRPVVEPKMSDLSSSAVPARASQANPAKTKGRAGTASEDSTSIDGSPPRSRTSSGGCAVAAGADSWYAAALYTAVLGAWLARRRRRA
jgi:hypothetical protein